VPDEAAIEQQKHLANDLGPMTSSEQARIAEAINLAPGDVCKADAGVA
jgi:hypothetical protein